MKRLPLLLFLLAACGAPAPSVGSHAGGAGGTGGAIPADGGSGGEAFFTYCTSPPPEASWSFDFSVAPLEGDEALTTGSFDHGFVVVRPHERPRRLDRDARWLDWDVAPGARTAAGIAYPDSGGSTQLELVDVDTGSRITLPAEQPCYVTFSPDGRHLAIVEKDRTTVRDLSGRILRERPGKVYARPLFSPDGVSLALALEDERSLVLWSAADERVLARIETWGVPVPLRFPTEDTVLYLIDLGPGAGTGDLLRVSAGSEPVRLLAPPLFFAWDVDPAGARMAWSENPEWGDTVGWLSPPRFPPTDHHLIHTASLEAGAAETTFAVPDVYPLAIGRDGRIAFACGGALFVSDAAGDRIRAVASDVPSGHDIRWIPAQ